MELKHARVGQHRSLALAIVLVAFALVWAWGRSPETSLSTRAIAIGTGTLTVEVADTAQGRARGLSGRPDLPENRGMLFIFPGPGMYPFWMKEMRFPLDIVWLDDQYHVVSKAENVSPATYPMTFSPPRPARFVLEVRAGVAKKLGLE